MNKDHLKEIGDDEIRIISRSRNSVAPKSYQVPNPTMKDAVDKDASDRKTDSKSSFRTYKLIIGIMVVLIILLLLFIFLRNRTDEKNFVEESIIEAYDVNARLKEYSDIRAEDESKAREIFSSAGASNKSYVEFSQVDTELSSLIILTPKNATPRLEVGQECIHNPKAKMLFQAADVRGDNKQINGAFVLKGELLSRGQSKSGYCAIIDGEVNLGIAEATPLLEKAIETDGYFFRQYPLVAAGQIVENNPKNRSYRKALAKIGDKTVVVLSQKRLTLHDFSRALIDAGVTEAIYLIGANAYGFAVDSSGKKVTFGDVNDSDLENLNYIAWY